MYNRIRAWWLKHHEGQTALKDLQHELEVLKTEIDRIEGEWYALIKRCENGQQCVEAVMGRGIDYYDPAKLEYAEQVAYKNSASEVLKNAAFQNEVRHLEADWVEFCAKEAKDFGAVRDMRMCINALELIQARLASVPDPRKPKDETNPFEAI